jgi:hypothetical protein
LNPRFSQDSEDSFSFLSELTRTEWGDQNLAPNASPREKSAPPAGLGCRPRCRRSGAPEEDSTTWCQGRAESEGREGDCYSIGGRELPRDGQFPRL